LAGLVDHMRAQGRTMDLASMQAYRERYGV
jgi:hypothetical protein